MNVLIVGANGQIGKLLAEQLFREQKHTVTAMVRHEEQAEELRKKGMQAVVANLLDRVEDLVQVVKGYDAIVFTAGSGGSTGADMTLLIDLDGAVKIIEAAEQAGIKRLVMVSAMGAHKRERWSEKIRPYYVAKHYADRVLESSALDYTIVRPGGLLNESGTGSIAFADTLEPGAIPREDVAAVIAALLDDKRTYRTAFDLTSGSTPIEQAFGG